MAQEGSEVMTLRLNPIALAKLQSVRQLSEKAGLDVSNSLALNAAAVLLEAYLVSAAREDRLVEKLDSLIKVSGRKYPVRKAA